MRVAIQEREERHSVVEWLESETSVLLSDIEGQEFWSALMNPNVDPQFARVVMSEVYADIVAYQPHVIEAAIDAIAQMPRSMNPKLVRSMLHHQAEEFDHGEMALRDLVGLGGDEAVIRKRQMSPEAFAVAGVWWMVVHARDPFAYLGALFLFEGVTPRVTGLIKGKLQAKGFEPSALEYITFHSTEDIKHATLVHHLISETAAAYPDAVSSIRLGYEAFRTVYPIPIWKAAFHRAQAVWSQARR